MNHSNRTIGSLDVYPLGLGCMGMSLAYGRPDVAEARRTLGRAVELGVTLFDTADVYGKGGNERLLADALAPYRDSVAIATKVGLRTNLLGVPNRVDGRPDYLRRAIDGSLKRLRMDTIDLLYLHRVDPKVPVEDSIGAMAEAVTAGKVRELGISEVSAEDLRRAATAHRISALQTEWSLFSRDIEHKVLPVARELGVAVVPYAPLGRGMLTGSPEATTKLPLLDFRRTLPRWRRANLEKNMQAVARVQDIARTLEATAAQVALAWLLAQGQDVIPIPGTKRVHNLQQNLQALDVTLSAQDEQALSALTATGDRYARQSATPGVG